MVTLSPSADCSRRSFLGSVAVTAFGGVAGCLGTDTTAVRVLSAGSLAHTFEDHIGPAFKKETGMAVHGEYYGTNAVMRMVEEGTKHPDVIVSADATLLRDRLYGEFTDWDVEFVTNSLGIGYDKETTFGQQLEDGKPWYELALKTDKGDISIGDPDLDPLGYRAIQAFELAERSHEVEGFKEAMMRLVYEEPEEPQLLAGVESGSRAASIVYRNMAIDHGLSFFEFPDEYNFADPSLADHYGTVEYTTDEEGYTAVGRPILYNATVNNEADEPDGALRLVQFLVDNPDMLVDAGLTVGAPIPRQRGERLDSIDV